MTLSSHSSALSRLERLAARDGASSSASVARVHRLDGRTAVVAIRDDSGWRRVHRIRWTARSIQNLREQRVREVLIRRGVRRGRLPLAWIPRFEGV